MNTYPRYALEDFVVELPRIQFDRDAALRFIMSNLNMFNDERCDHLETGFIPSWWAETINRQFIFNEEKWNYGIPLFSQPCVIVSRKTGTHFIHTDRSRPSALNFFLHGDPTDSTTFFDVRGERVHFQYKPNVATLFNTQISHGVDYHNDNLSVRITFRCSIGLQHFAALLRATHQDKPVIQIA